MDDNLIVPRSKRKCNAYAQSFHKQDGRRYAAIEAAELADEGVEPFVSSPLPDPQLL